jgi:hypothetical protein
MDEEEDNERVGRTYLCTEAGGEADRAALSMNRPADWADTVKLKLPFTCK